MKNITAIIAGVVLTLSVTAYAADTASYDTALNGFAVSSDIGNYQTVLITKAETDISALQSDNIVYVDQASDVFSASMRFMLASVPDAGDYQIRMGNETGDTKLISLTVGSAVSAEPVELRLLATADGSTAETKNMEFVGEAIELGKYNAVKIVINRDGENVVSGGYRIADIFDTVVTGAVELGLQINNVPVEYADHISIYLDNEISE